MNIISGGLLRRFQRSAAELRTSFPYGRADSARQAARATLGQGALGLHRADFSAFLNLPTLLGLVGVILRGLTRALPDCSQESSARPG